LSRSRTLLGTLEIYGCDPRLPTALETQVIQRVARLTAIALQRYKDAEELERASRNSPNSLDNDEPEPPPFIN
jgi:GAF domain-containing protein